MLGLRAPANTLLTGPRRHSYQLVEGHYLALVEHLAAHERTLPRHVQREFENFLSCERLEHGY